MDVKIKKMDKKKIVKVVKKWVEESYQNAEHLLRTGYWLKKLDPKADLASVVAAITHNIERAFQKDRKPPVRVFGKGDDKTYSVWHGKRSADFVVRFLKKKRIKDREFLDKVKRLIISHESGGDREQNLIRDADSLSFLEINALFFLSRIPQELSKQEVKEKFDYMYQRVNSNKVKEMVKPFYEKALADLKELKVR